MVSPADRRYAALQRRSASDTNFRCSKGKWFRLRKPGLHRFLISGSDLGIDARFSPFTHSCVHRFLISGPNSGIDAAPSLLHRRMARLQHRRGVQAGTGCHEGGITLRNKPPEWHLPLPRQRYASDSNPTQFIGRSTKKRLSTM